MGSLTYEDPLLRLRIMRKKINVTDLTYADDNNSIFSLFITMASVSVWPLH